MAFLVFGYPFLEAADYRRIQAFRADHDPQFRIVAPHFTLVFPVENLPEETLIPHVRRIAKPHSKVDFMLRSAKLMPQMPDEESAPICLIPDEGHGTLVQLHDQLYSGPLAEHRHRDRPFVPHVTIGRHADRAVAQQLVAELNQQGLNMPGTITRLTLVRFANGLVTNLAEVPLLG